MSFILANLTLCRNLNLDSIDQGTNPTCFMAAVLNLLNKSPILLQYIKDRNAMIFEYVIERKFDFKEECKTVPRDIEERYFNYISHGYYDLGKSLGKLNYDGGLEFEFFKSMIESVNGDIEDTFISETVDTRHSVSSHTYHSCTTSMKERLMAGNQKIGALLIENLRFDRYYFVYVYKHLISKGFHVCGALYSRKDMKHAQSAFFCENSNGDVQIIDCNSHGRRCDLMIEDQYNKINQFTIICMLNESTKGDNKVASKGNILTYDPKKIKEGTNRFLEKGTLIVEKQKHGKVIKGTMLNDAYTDQETTLRLRKKNEEYEYKINPKSRYVRVKSSSVSSLNVYLEVQLKRDDEISIDFIPGTKNLPRDRNFACNGISYDTLRGVANYDICDLSIRIYKHNLFEFIKSFQSVLIQNMKDDEFLNMSLELYNYVPEILSFTSLLISFQMSSYPQNKLSKIKYSSKFSNYFVGSRSSPTFPDILESTLESKFVSPIQHLGEENNESMFTDILEGATRKRDISYPNSSTKKVRWTDLE